MATQPDMSGYRLDVYDSQTNDDEEDVRVQAAVFDGSDAVVVSDWFDVSEPGDEESYDDALADACSDAEDKLVAKLRDDHGLSHDDAEDLVDTEVGRGDMPTPR